jgi:hypothetical protein
MKLATGWWGIGLEPFRNREGTYNRFPVESLPPVPTLDPGFGWLAGADTYGAGMAPAELPVELPSSLDTALPAAFTEFFSQPELQTAFSSATDCWWDVSRRAVPGPLQEGDLLVRFLNDSQGCLFWYLSVLPDGGHKVLCGAGHYDGPDRFAPEEMRADLVVVADNFEEFLYRYRVENAAFFEIVYDKLAWDELSPQVRDYLRHYQVTA